jgi:outer membrane protein TolC
VIRLRAGDREYQSTNDQGAKAQSPNEVESSLDASSGLEDYLAYAAMKNAGLEAAFNRWRAALERVPQVESLPDPRFTYRYFIREVETRVGPMEQGAGLSQTFPWFGELELRGDAAAEAAKAERQRYEAVKLALFYEVTDAYNEYYFLGQAIAVVKENLDLIEYLEGVARARYRTDAASHPDVIRAQVELGKLEDQLDALRDLRGPVVARLNAVLNRPAHAELPFPRSVGTERLAEGDDSVLVTMADHNPELRALDHRIEQAGIEIDVAKTEYYPDITFGVEYTDVGDAMRPAAQGFRNPAALRSASRIGNGMGDLIDAYAIGRSFTPGDRPDDSGQDVWAVTLSMNIPIWRDKYAAGEREARARKLSAMSDRRQREHDLAASVKRALYEYRDAERKITLYRDTLIPKANESIESTETAFRAGTATFLELVDAERSLLDFGLSYERALANRSSRLAELDRLAGTKLPRETETTDEPAPAPGESGD